MPGHDNLEVNYYAPFTIGLEPIYQTSKPRRLGAVNIVGCPTAVYMVDRPLPNIIGPFKNYSANPCPWPTRLTGNLLNLAALAKNEEATQETFTRLKAHQEDIYLDLTQRLQPMPACDFNELDKLAYYMPFIAGSTFYEFTFQKMTKVAIIAREVHHSLAYTHLSKLASEKIGVNIEDLLKNNEPYHVRLCNAQIIEEIVYPAHNPAFAIFHDKPTATLSNTHVYTGFNAVFTIIPAKEVTVPIQEESVN